MYIVAASESDEGLVYLLDCMREDLRPVWDKNLVTLIIIYVEFCVIFIMVTNYLYIIQDVSRKVKCGDVVMIKIGLKKY